MANNDINQPGIDPKQLKRQERQKMYENLQQQKKEKKQAKIAERKKIREEYIRQNTEINKYEQICKADIKKKLVDLKTQVQSGKLNKKEAKMQFKTYRKERISQFRQDEQRVLNLSSEQLRQSFSFRFRRWFFGVGKEFSRVT
jgi:ribonuclease HII